MHVHDRWRRILDVLTPEKVTLIEDLSDKLSVSPATVRRDLNELDRLGRIRRVRGGALPVGGAAAEDLRSPRLQGQVAFSETEISNAEAKRAIGRRAIDFCSPGQSIIIDGGSTTFMMASQLPNDPYHVLTTSIPILNCLLPKSNVRLTLPGGELFREQGIVLNPYEDEILQNFSASVIFMGAQAITARGLMQTDPLLVQTERRLIERANRIVVLADSSKIDASASLAVCPLSRIDVLVTDGGLTEQARSFLDTAQIEVVIASR
jgi:DeoR family ulaG and ulaABCDEF operon transcriptional repressor